MTEKVRAFEPCNHIVRQYDRAERPWMIVELVSFYLCRLWRKGVKKSCLEWVKRAQTVHLEYLELFKVSMS